jgi:hypothetical protein
MTNPRGSGPNSGPTCSKCGKPVLLDQLFRLRHGEIEHRFCDVFKEGGTGSGPNLVVEEWPKDSESEK